MGLCLQCKKWVNQTKGKKAKQFCNDTCRSNYRYAKNKKKMPKEDDLKREIKFVTPTPASYDSHKMSKITYDEPKMWQEPIDVKAVFDRFVAEIPNLEFPDEYKDFFQRVKKSGLPPKKQEELINGSRKTNF